MKSLRICMIWLLCAGTVMAMEESPVGSIKTLEGEVVITRNGQDLLAKLPGLMFKRDEIRTGPDGRVGIVLRDDTLLSLGPQSRLVLADFVFEPKHDRFSVWIKMLKGTFVYLSGVIAKLSPDSIRLETPDSTIAVRGTKLLIRVDGS